MTKMTPLDCARKCGNQRCTYCRKTLSFTFASAFCHRKLQVLGYEADSQRQGKQNGFDRKSETPGRPTLFGWLFRTMGPKGAPDPGPCRGADRFGRNTRELLTRRPMFPMTYSLVMESYPYLKVIDPWFALASLPMRNSALEESAKLQ